MTTPRNRRPLDRVGQRAAGRRRIAGATALSATGGAALALAFGAVFAQGAAAADPGAGDSLPTVGVAPAAAILPARPAPAAAKPAAAWPSAAPTPTSKTPTSKTRTPTSRSPETGTPKVGTQKLGTSKAPATAAEAKPKVVVETPAATDAPQPPAEAPKASTGRDSDASSGGS